MLAKGQKHLLSENIQIRDNNYIVFTCYSDWRDFPLVRTVEFIFSLFPANRGKDYVQGWYCWPDFMGRWSWPGYVRGEGEDVEFRVNPLYTFRTWFCGVFVGHEISKTEWGWSGGMVDCHCRWCDKVKKIPKNEARFRFDTFNEWGKDIFE